MQPLLYLLRFISGVLVSTCHRLAIVFVSMIAYTFELNSQGLFYIPHDLLDNP